jgi:hypothetical protein
MADEEKDALVPIAHPFTLDKRWSEFNEDRPPGFMSHLKNYIPQNHVLKTRKGIVSLAHTPEGTTPWNPVDNPTYTAEGETAICKAVFTFPSTPLIGFNAVDDTVIYSAMITPVYSGYSTVSSVRFKQGSSSFLSTNDTAIASAATGEPNYTYGLRTYPPKTEPSWMPGSQSSAARTFLITYWLYPLRANASANAEWHFTFGNELAGVGDLAFGGRHFDTSLQGYYNGTSFQISNIMIQDQWQFIAFWADGAKGTRGCYHYDDVLGVATWTSSDSISTFSKFRVHSSTNTLNGKWQRDATGDGPRCDVSDAGSFYMDYVTMWDGLFTINSSNITLIEAIRDLHKA